MGRTKAGVMAFIFCLQTQVGSAIADRIDDALALSLSEDRPLLAIGSADFCPPCRALHQTIETDPQLRPLLENCVLLEMDSQTQEFQNFVNRFPADARKIPMVYVLLPGGQPIYAQSGGMNGNALAVLLREAISYSHPRDKQTILASAESDLPVGVNLDEMLKSARQHAQAGKLIDALEIVTPIAVTHDDSPQVVKARAYKARLEAVIRQWMSDLASQLDQNQSAHGAAYRIAELYVRTSDHPQLREQARRLLKRFETNAATRNPVKQAKHLLQARFFETREDSHNAMANYQAVLAIDSTSPAADFANSRLDKLQERERNAVEMTAQSR